MTSAGAWRLQPYRPGEFCSDEDREEGQQADQEEEDSHAHRGIDTAQAGDTGNASERLAFQVFHHFSILPDRDGGGQAADTNQHQSDVPGQMVAGHVAHGTRDGFKFVAVGGLRVRHDLVKRHMPLVQSLRFAGQSDRPVVVAFESRFHTLSASVELRAAVPVPPHFQLAMIGMSSPWVVMYSRCSMRIF